MPSADSTQGTQSEGDGADAHKLERMLPSETTETEPWSTNVDMLHENIASNHGASHRTAKDKMGVSASLHGLVDHHAGIAAEPTFSMTSNDVSPDRSSMGTM